MPPEDDEPVPPAEELSSLLPCANWKRERERLDGGSSGICAARGAGCSSATPQMLSKLGRLAAGSTQPGCCAGDFTGVAPAGARAAKWCSLTAEVEDDSEPND